MPVYALLLCFTKSHEVMRGIKSKSMFMFFVILSGSSLKEKYYAERGKFTNIFCDIFIILPPESVIKYT